MDLGGTGHLTVQTSLARLQDPTTTIERIEILEKLVRYWHPPILLEDGTTRDELGSVRLPTTLARWLLWAGNRREIMSGQNRLLAPNEIIVKDGVLIFYLENQGVYQWTTSCESDDPPVLGRYESSDPWTPEGMTLTEHLIRMCFFEAIFSAPCSASTGWLEGEEFEHVRKGVFMRAGTCPKDAKESGYSLWIGAKRPDPMGFLRPLVDKYWDHVEF